MPVLFTGDAAKNRAELMSGEVDASEDHAQSNVSLKTIWYYWRKQPGSLLVTGYDLSMRLDGAGRPEYIGERSAATAAWFSESLELSTTIDLCGHAGFCPGYR